MRSFLPLCLVVCFFTEPTGFTAYQNHSTENLPQTPIPEKNKKVIEYVTRNGLLISPTYEKAVCTELVIAVLQQFVPLNREDRKRIRIISDKTIEQMRLAKSPELAGVQYALIAKGKGVAIADIKKVQPGDFVQFWYTSWGHCGIVKSIDAGKMTMELYSSFPTTNGYGIQTFTIPTECYFVRLK